MVFSFIRISIANVIKHKAMKNLDENVSDKRCHNCLRSLPFWEFFPVMVGTQSDGYFQSNNCIDCYFDGATAKKSMEAFGVDRELSEKEMNGREATELRKSYECAFVGNTGYKDICKTYKIKL